VFYAPLKGKDELWIFGRVAVGELQLSRGAIGEGGAVASTVVSTDEQVQLFRVIQLTGLLALQCPQWLVVRQMGIHRIFLNEGRRHGVEDFEPEIWITQYTCLTARASMLNYQEA
jgi:hypothetical protein